MPSRSPWRSARRAGLELVDILNSEPSLQGYHLLPSVRGDFLAKLGRLDRGPPRGPSACRHPRAHAREREFLLERARSCTDGITPPASAQ